MRPYRGMTKEGKWVYGWLVKGECCYIITPELFYSAVVSTTNPNHMSTSCFQVLPETVGQQVGLKDKNEKDLDWWEGDKFRIDGHLYVIVFDKGCFWFDGLDMPYRYTADSVSRRPNGNVPSKIGTVHEKDTGVDE